MTDNNRRRYEMLVRVRDFGAAYAHLFPKSTLAEQAFAAVIAGVGGIDAHDLTEASASVSARATRKAEARRALVERLLSIRKTAGVFAGANEQLRAYFALPEAKHDDALLRAARHFLKQGAPVAAQFIEHGMPPTFLVDLGTLIEKFEEALRDRGMSRADQVAARSRIKTSLANALDAVRKLDVIVANHLAPDSEVREVWKRTRRVEYHGRGRRPAFAKASAGEGAGVPGVEPADAVPSSPTA
jgi:hypothetical protein